MFGDVAGTQSFYPFGEVRLGTGLFDTERDFTGQIADAATGLNFYNARYMDPVLGRFISPDSIVPSPYLASDYNRFVYVRNNPLRYIDPTGHCSYAGENDSCDYVEEGSNSGAGIFTDEALANIKLADIFLDLYDHVRRTTRDQDLANGVFEFEDVVARSIHESLNESRKYFIDQLHYSGICVVGNGVVGIGPVGSVCRLYGSDGEWIWDLASQASIGYDVSVGLGIFISNCLDTTCLNSLENGGVGIGPLDFNYMKNSDGNFAIYVGPAVGALFSASIPMPPVPEAEQSVRGLDGIKRWMRSKWSQATNPN